MRKITLFIVFVFHGYYAAYAQQSITIKVAEGSRFTVQQQQALRPLANLLDTAETGIKTIEMSNVQEGDAMILQRGFFFSLLGRDTLYIIIPSSLLETLPTSKTLQADFGDRFDFDFEFMLLKKILSYESWRTLIEKSFAIRLVDRFSNDNLPLPENGLFEQNELYKIYKSLRMVKFSFRMLRAKFVGDFKPLPSIT
ncbi:MAG: hypothetical protein KDK51_10465 [Deltaproteobacteria bacterium]|nr:hypothetical protein [Deltaproteobacteria bacterium]